MSDFMDMFVDLLSARSKLNSEKNPLRQVFDKTMGEWFDNHEDLYEQVFLGTATGKWLDAHGRDFGVYRKENESDDEYRQRIYYEKMDKLTVNLLRDVYGVNLYSFVNDFSISDNVLVSDNPYVNNNGYLGDGEDNIRVVIDKKFVLGDRIEWL